MNNDKLTKIYKEIGDKTKSNKEAVYSSILKLSSAGHPIAFRINQRRLKIKEKETSTNTKKPDNLRRETLIFLEKEYKKDKNKIIIREILDLKYGTKREIECVVSKYEKIKKE